MHFFPGIYEPKRGKKATSFCSPITGAFYSNKDFLKNCKNVPRSISELDHIKNIKFEVENEENTGKERKNAEKKNSITRIEDRKKMEREIIAIHVTNKLAEPTNKSFHESAILSRKCKKAFDNDTLKQIERASLNKTFLSSHSQREERKSQEIKAQNKGFSANNGKITNMSDEKRVKSSNVVHGSVSFSDIEILLLDLLEEKEDFRTKVVRINLQKYFRSFFKKQLYGHLTQEFLDKVEYYIEELLAKEKIDQEFDQQQYPVELFTISSRIIFINKILEFEARKTSSNEDNIRTMIKYYCVPSKEFRESCLRDIILMLTLEIYEKFNCSRQHEYILLDEEGNEIKEILQIKFSTKKLLLTSKSNASKNFNNYVNLLDEFYREGKKLTFTENIKLNFRHKLAQGNYDDQHFNYLQNYELHKLKRLIELENAENLLNKKSQTHRINKFVPKEESFIQENSKNIANSESHTENDSKLNTLDQYVEKSKIETQTHLWKRSEKKISPELTNKRSVSPQRTKSPVRNRSPLKSNSQASKERLQDLLKDDKNKAFNAEMEKKCRVEFRDLVSKNDIIDFRFNHYIKNKVMKEVLKTHFIYFKDKTGSQINRIIQSIKSINIDTGNDESISMEDSIKNKEPVVPGEQKEDEELGNEEKQKYIEESLSWEEFKKLKTIAGCSEPKEVIMSFIANYFNFNEFGELSKQDLFKEVEFILEGKCDQPTAEVIVDVIWSWFESNSIIENGFIRRMTLESWYEKYKIVYFMLVSLIFGSNHKTVLDLAYEVLV